MASYEAHRRLDSFGLAAMMVPVQRLPTNSNTLVHWPLFGALGSVDDPFIDALSQSEWTSEQKASIIEALTDLNLYAETAVSPSNNLLSICQGLTATEISQMLIRDFQMPPLMANQVRTIVMRVWDGQQLLQRTLPTSIKPSEHSEQPRQQQERKSVSMPAMSLPTTENSPTAKPPRQYKAAIVNKSAARRKQKQSQTYQLDTEAYPRLSKQLEEYYQFMVEPSTLSQEDPIRPATANVYLLHAKLFLGWYVSQKLTGATVPDHSRITLSLHDIIASKEKEAASIAIEFILWLRKERHISVNYEANLLRGLIKLLKFCFASESHGGDNRRTYEDIPIIQELRRLHRNAHKQAKLAPKSSDEGQKWMTWPEYLRVVQAIKADYQRLYGEWSQSRESGSSEKELASLERKVALALQRYLVLAIFTNVPDRQRTVRELEIGRTLVKDDLDGGRWYVKHNPDDYKTGATYGERPPMLLSVDLSEQVDQFILLWRAKLEPKTDFLFVQPRTGNPFTRDSVYSTVSRACYEYAGKRTNPHLLRDMIVTHIRESNASEKELEALALYMGHSIQMQRTSYDRRTLERKVAPAIELLTAVNGEDANLGQSQVLDL